MSIKVDSQPKKFTGVFTAYAVALLSVLYVTSLTIGAAHAKSSENKITVVGPITAGKQGKPFSAPRLDVEKYGYVVEEFFIEGAASAYELAPGGEHSSDGKWEVRRKSDSVPYKTRILVVRPTDPKKFNGTVIVNWQNVTAGYELGSVDAAEYIRGYAWVAVSVQKVGIDGFAANPNGLKTWDPDRYGSLNHPGDEYSYDIFTQAGRTVSAKRPKLANDPMGKLPVKRLIATGNSQSAARLRSYINGVHPVENLFDGYVPYIDFSNAIPFDAKSGGVTNMGRVNIKVRDDLKVPVFVVNSETEAQGYIPARQPDTDKFRFWEVAGSSHVTLPRLIPGQEPDSSSVTTRAGLDSPNWLSYQPVYLAALRHMHTWLTTGVAPPHAPLIEITDTKPITIKRDSRGNVLGGIRLPSFAVPSAEHRGFGNRKPGGTQLGFLYGYARDFSAEELKALYPDSATYMAAFDKALEQIVKDGYVLAEDAPAMRQAAAEWAKRLDVAPTN